YFYGRFYSGKYPAENFPHLIDSDTFGTKTATGTGSWAADVVDAGVLGGDYARFNGNAGDTGNFVAPIPTAAARLTYATAPVRVFARCKCDETDATIQLTDLFGASIIYEVTAPVSVSATGQWELLDVGLINPVDLYNLSATSLSGPSSPTFTITTPTASTVFDIDAVILFPTAEYMITNSDGALPSGELTHIINPPTKTVYNPASGNNWIKMGGMFYAKTGNAVTRTFRVVETSDIYVITDVEDATITITPRVRHLWGTR
ncbi:MAG: hypothetical protein ACYTFK_14210, partial [Planctomycetota bacterium]